MRNRTFTIASPRNKLVTLDIIPGHFTTSTSHLTHYLDMSRLKFDAMIARNVAHELAAPYLSSSLVDTIICMEETEVIGAYLAEELLKSGTMVVNSGRQIHVLTPTNNTQGQFIFPKNTEDWVFNKHVVLLAATVASGKTVNQALECIRYYNGLLVGVSALFESGAKVAGQEINTIFSGDAIPGYHVYKPEECALCQEGQKLDAIVNHSGYFQL